MWDKKASTPKTQLLPNRKKIWHKIRVKKRCHAVCISSFLKAKPMQKIHRSGEEGSREMP
jgi:hypothetical protein